MGWVGAYCCLLKAQNWAPNALFLRSKLLSSRVGGEAEARKPCDVPAVVVGSNPGYPTDIVRKIAYTGHSD